VDSDSGPFVAHLFVTVIKIATPSSARSVVAELLILKHQLLIPNRSRKRAPKLLRTSSRVGSWDLVLSGRIFDGVAVCRMFNHARFGQGLPRRLSTDHDPLFRFHRWRANLRILDIEELKSIPSVPRSHPFVERLIGTVRREYLDRVLVWNGLDLQRKLERFAVYYNQRRVHAALGGRTPAECSGANGRGRLFFCLHATFL
jgi:Integrase core domain